MSPTPKPTTTTAISPKDLMSLNQPKLLLPRRGGGTSAGIASAAAGSGLSTTNLILVVVFSTLGGMLMILAGGIWRARRKAKFIKERQEALVGSWAPKSKPKAGLPQDGEDIPQSDSPGVHAVDDKDIMDAKEHDGRKTEDDKHNEINGVKAQEQRAEQ